MWVHFQPWCVSFYLKCHVAKHPAGVLSLSLACALSLVHSHQAAVRSASTSADMTTNAACSNSYTHSTTLTKINLRTSRHLLLCLLCWFFYWLLHVRINYCKVTDHHLCSTAQRSQHISLYAQSCFPKIAGWDERETVRVSQTLYSPTNAHVEFIKTN